MWKNILKLIVSTLIIFNLASSAHAWDKGIYLTQYMLEKSDKLDYLLREAKATGLNSFVIDHEYFSKYYAPAIAKVKAAGLKVITRIVVFTEKGGNAKQVRSQAYWEDKFKLIEDAIKAGSDVIQLDYIRYSSKEPANPQHAKDVYKVIKWFKAKINALNVPMEIDIFGEVSYHPSLHIGQDLRMFSDSVDGMNPMVYPSHFWPYQKYSAEPYKTINNSLNALVGHFDNKPPFKVHAFIEAANYHYVKKTSNAEKQKYLLQEIRAVEDAKNVSGWYVWSANNVYENLFKVLKNNKTKTADFLKTKTADLPKTNTADAPKTTIADAPKAKTADLPKTNTADAPKTKTADAPKTKTADAPKTKTADAPKTKTADAPKTKTANTPKTKTADLPKTNTAGKIIQNDNHFFIFNYHLYN